MKARYVKTLETLGEHSRPLAPLRHGDHVMVQNQSGRFPKRWDKSGVIVEVRNNDQYVVKVAGSGRLTLRNRRFLRLYTLQPHTIALPLVTQETTEEPSNFGPVPATPSVLPSAMPPVVKLATPAVPPNDVNPSPATPHRTPTDATPSRSPVSQHSARSHSSTMPTPQRLVFGDVHEDVQTEIRRSPVEFTRRSSRVPQQRLLYDASSGEYKPPTVTPDDI